MIPRKTIVPVFLFACYLTAVSHIFFIYSDFVTIKALGSVIQFISFTLWQL